MSNFLSLEIGKRSIMTHQTALSVTGHNVANANTAGYTRQVANLVTTRPYYTPTLTANSGVGQLGTGVEVATLERIRDSFLDGQIRNENKTLGYWEAIYDTLAKIEVILNEPSENGLRTVMDQFWESWQDLSAHPENESVRAVVVQRGAALADAFNHIHKQLTELREDVNAFVQVKVNEINSIAQQLADLNQQILSITIAGKQPNDLLDKRDLLLDELSKIVSVTVNYDQYGMVSVQMGGRPLVQGNDHALLDLKADTKGTFQVIWADTKAVARIDDGELRGLLDARGATELDASPSIYKEIIPNMIDKLNELAKAIVLETNSVHRNGYSLTNETNLNFFNEPTSASDGYQWAAMIQVDNAIYNDPKKIAAASEETWKDGVESNFGDGSNALKIAQLKHTLIMGGTTTTDDFWRSICAQVGVMAQESVRMVHNQEILLNELENKRQSVSGVSLDEEMTNMIKFQHAYNAASRYITAIDEAIEVIINRMGLVGR